MQIDIVRKLARKLQQALQTLLWGGAGNLAGEEKLILSARPVQP
ncbi:hypothetical protein [Pseudogemmobacter faecipullorum]|nr:hypothetical protein [Pseudogemmobacter faecipullorum]